MLQFSSLLRRCSSRVILEQTVSLRITSLRNKFTASTRSLNPVSTRVVKTHVSKRPSARPSTSAKQPLKPSGDNKYRRPPSQTTPSTHSSATRSPPKPRPSPAPQNPTSLVVADGIIVDGDATFVPRNPGVKDGIWSSIDTTIVRKATADAVLAASPESINAEGTVLLGKSEAELRQLAASSSQPEYRGKQLYDALLKGAKSLDAITTLPKEWREALVKAGVRTGRSHVHSSVGAPDGTRKFLLQLADGRVVETVGIPADDVGTPRLTVCVSSQVGCPMRCTFCATGKGGFARNLKPHEIVDQVLTVQEMFDRRVTNVVFMGMGEPLLNLPSVVASFHILNAALGIGARNITISTVGVPNAIAKLAAHNLRSTLAVSIHAPNQRLRERLIPSAKAYPLDALMDDCVSYFKATGRRVTFEYTLMAGANDAKEHAVELAALLKSHDLVSHVNVIPWNPVDESDYQRPSNNSVYRFKEVLEAAGLPVTVRITRGLEAAAACGQLRNSFQKQPLEQFAVPL